jgi:hypothetical protein
MNARNLGILAGITAAVAALAALAIWKERSAVAPSAQTGPVVPTLADKINDAMKLEVIGGDQSLTVERAQGSPDWLVADLGGYPARFEKVKETLVGLAELEKAEPRTDQPGSYEKIGVQDPAPGNEAILVRVSGESGTPLASVIVGKAKTAGSTRQVYVRVPDQKQSWLATGDLSVKADPLEWIDREVMKLDSTRTKSVAITHPDGSRLVIARPSPDAPYVVEGIPEGRTLTTPSAGSPVASALSFLNLDGVRPAAEVAFDAPDSPVIADYRTFDGLVVSVATVDLEGSVWAKFDVSFDESAIAPAAVPPTPTDGTEPTEEERAAALKAAEDLRQREIDRVKAEAEALRAKLGAWAYQVPKAKADMLRRKLDDLLAAPPEPAPSDPSTEGEGEGDSEEGTDPFGIPPE